MVPDLLFRKADSLCEFCVMLLGCVVGCKLPSFLRRSFRGAWLAELWLTELLVADYASIFGSFRE